MLENGSGVYNSSALQKVPFCLNIHKNKSYDLQEMDILKTTIANLKNENAKLRSDNVDLRKRSNNNQDESDKVYLQSYLSKIIIVQSEIIEEDDDDVKNILK